MSCIDLYLIEKVYPVIFFYIHCVNTSGLKLKFQCFQRRLRPLHFWLCQMKITNVPILPVNLPRPKYFVFWHLCGKMVWRPIKEYFLINFSEIIFSPASDRKKVTNEQKNLIIINKKKKEKSKNIHPTDLTSLHNYLTSGGRIISSYREYNI